MRGAMLSLPNTSQWRVAWLSTGYVLMTYNLVRHTDSFTFTIHYHIPFAISHWFYIIFIASCYNLWSWPVSYDLQSLLINKKFCNDLPQFLRIFKSYHPFINAPLTHTSITTPNCHSSINFATFHTLRPEKSDHSSLSFCGVFCQFISHVNTQKITGTNWIQIYRTSFSVPPT
jgi:hypothetical protein